MPNWIPKTQEESERWWGESASEFRQKYLREERTAKRHRTDLHDSSTGEQHGSLRGFFRHVEDKHGTY